MNPDYDFSIMALQLGKEQQVSQKVFNPKGQNGVIGRTMARTVLPRIRRHVLKATKLVRSSHFEEDKRT